MDRPQRILVFNVYFTTLLAESAIFHVTDADGGVADENGDGGEAEVDVHEREGSASRIPTQF